jgi:hypothetical protein
MRGYRDNHPEYRIRDAARRRRQRRKTGVVTRIVVEELAKNAVRQEFIDKPGGLLG